MWRDCQKRIGKTFLVLLMLQTYICDWDSYGKYSCELISEPKEKVVDDDLILKPVIENFDIDDYVINSSENDEREW